MISEAKALRWLNRAGEAMTRQEGKQKVLAASVCATMHCVLCVVPESKAGRNAVGDLLAFLNEGEPALDIESEVPADGESDERHVLVRRMLAPSVN